MHESILYFSEAIWEELIVPEGLVESFVHAESIMVDSLIMPGSLLVKNEHLFVDSVSIDHIKIKGLVLLEEGHVVRCAPVVILGHWNHLINGQSDGVDTPEAKSINLKELSLWVESHAHDEVLWSEASLDQEWDQAENLALASQTAHVG